MPNSQTAFFPQLEGYITKYVVPRPIPLTPAEIAEQPTKWAQAVAALFEQLLLFDHLAIRIRGQNLPLVMLHELFGTKGVENLIDQDALRFIQWKPAIFNFVTPIKGVNALAFGDLNPIPLVYDLMEPLRPVVDRKVLEFALSHTFAPGDFTITQKGGCRLNPQMAKVVASQLAQLSAEGIVNAFLQHRL